jgi:hypothetical protein
MNTISKNIFSTEKISKKKKRGTFFNQEKPVKPRNIESIFENSWVQSSKNNITKHYYSKDNSNLTSLVNNPVIKTGSIRANRDSQQFISTTRVLSNWKTFTRPMSSRTVPN